MLWVKNKIALVQANNKRKRKQTTVELNIVKRQRKRINLKRKLIESEALIYDKYMKVLNIWYKHKLKISYTL